MLPIYKVKTRRLLLRVLHQQLKCLYLSGNNATKTSLQDKTILNINADYLLCCRSALVGINLLLILLTLVNNKPRYVGEGKQGKSVC